MTDEQEANAEIERLRHDIEETRADMEETLEEIEDHIRPRNVALRQKEALRQRVREVAERGSERANVLQQDVKQRTQDLPVAPAAGALAGLTSTALVGQALRRRRARVRAEELRAARDAATATGVGTLLAFVGVARQLRRRTNRPAEQVAVRDLMTSDVVSVRRSDTLLDVVRQMRDLDVGALPVCDRTGRVRGMITDRDVTIGAVARGRDLRRTTVAKVMSRRPVAIRDDASAAAALGMMTRSSVRRLPVVDSRGRLLGVVSQGDVAVRIDDSQVGDLVGSISAAP